MASKEIEQLEAIRRSGETNMFVKGTVHMIALDNDFRELTSVIEDGDYAETLEELPVEGNIQYSVE